MLAGSLADALRAGGLRRAAATFSIDLGATLWI
jgi:hypothetical protein